MSEWTPRPWNLIWWGNEQYPFPLSVLADGNGSWIARDGTVSSEANARLIAAAPDLYEALADMLFNSDDARCRTAAYAALAKARGET